MSDCHCAANSHPDCEVLPGVKWGREDWFSSPAFWYSLAQKTSPGDDYIAPAGTPLHYELAFCILGGFGIKMEINRAAWQRLFEHGILEVGRRPLPSDIEPLLIRPLAIGNKHIRYRFPHQKSQRLSAALLAIEERPPRTESGTDFRNDLLQVPGVGPKTASWLARNWLGSEDVAILDVHVLRACKKMKLFRGHIQLPKDYEELERLFLRFAKALSVRPSLLDAIIWREMRGQYYS